MSATQATINDGVFEVHITLGVNTDGVPIVKLKKRRIGDTAWTFRYEEELTENWD